MFRIESGPRVLGAETDEEFGSTGRREPCSGAITADGAPGEGADGGVSHQIPGSMVEGLYGEGSRPIPVKKAHPGIRNPRAHLHQAVEAGPIA